MEVEKSRKAHCINLMENNPFFVVAGSVKKYDDED